MLMANLVDSFQISKDTVVRSIKNEIWKKPTKPQNTENGTENDIFLVNPMENANGLQIPDFKSDLKEMLNLDQQKGPLIIFDLHSHHEVSKKVRKLRKEMEDLEQMEPDLKKNNKFRKGQVSH